MCHSMNFLQIVLLILSVGVSAEETCFKGLNCFSQDYPWTSFLRPFPPPMSPEQMDFKVRVFTRQSVKGRIVHIGAENSVNLNRTLYNPKYPTSVIIHGFATTGKARWAMQIKDLYLKKVNGNVIVADWRKGATKQVYPQVAANTRVVGALVARLCDEMNAMGQNMSQVHLIGHSLGAHIAGYAGKKTNFPIGRITGLDPAQPGFEATPEEVRLSPDDANFVDAVHTDARPIVPFFGLGIMRPVGHVDLYVNGGSGQPKCLSSSIPNISNLTEVFAMPVEIMRRYFTCSHMRSYQLYIEAMDDRMNCTYWGRKMPVLETFLKITSLGTLSLADPLISSTRECTENVCTVMGLDTPLFPARGSFAVTTNAQPPYCKTDVDKARSLRSLLTGGFSGLANTVLNFL